MTCGAERDDDGDAAPPTCGAPGGNANANADGQRVCGRRHDGTAHIRHPRAPLPSHVPLLSAPGGSQCFHGLDHGSLPALSSPDTNMSPPLAWPWPAGRAAHCPLAAAIQRAVVVLRAVVVPGRAFCRRYVVKAVCKGQRPSIDPSVRGFW
jgi:hypothetical protein